MTFGESIKTCFSKYATFEGRASRSEYWWWILFYWLAILASAFIGGAISGGTNSEGGLILYWIAIIVLIIPTISVLVRRLHDIGKSGWWYWIGFIPLIGGIWLLVLLCTDSDYDENEYGFPNNELNEE